MIRGLMALIMVALATPLRGAEVTMTVRDLTPRFLTFYQEAVATHAPPDQRFALWKRDYDFAAVPPPPQGDQIARKLLDAAWPEYPSVLDQIKAGAAGIEPAPVATLRKVADLLQAEQPIHITLVAYVGALEGNAFTAADPRGVTVAIPVEQSAGDRGPVMTHEFTHAVQIAMGDGSGNWIRTVGETVLMEGLAMRTAEHFYPDRPPSLFVEMSQEPGWLGKSESMRNRILRDVEASLASDKSDDVMRFTMGTGPSGLDREAYYAGWTVVGYWLAHGLSYGDIARIKEADAPARIRSAIDQILKDH